MATLTGFQFIDAKGSIQIDQTQANLQLISKGIVTFTKSTKASANGAYTSVAAVSVNNLKYPMIAWRCSEYVSLVSGPFAGTGDFNFVSRNPNNPPTMEYFIFAKPQEVGNAGIKIYGANLSGGPGELYYNSNLKSMRVASYVLAAKPADSRGYNEGMPILDFGYTPWNWTFPAGPKYAIFSAGMTTEARSYYQGWLLYISSFALNNNVVYGGSINYSGGWPDFTVGRVSNVYGIGRWGFGLVDVSNY